MKTQRHLVSWTPALLIAFGCAPQPDAAEFGVREVDIRVEGALERAALGDDLAHYTLEVRVGDGANDVLRIHRVVREQRPWLPARLPESAMLLHGDFSTFESNYLPTGGGLAARLAGSGIDVWGVDRRWTRAPAGDADLTGFAEMGIEQELADTRRAIRLARALRFFGGAGGGRMALVGFSRGGHLAYLFAAQDGERRRWRRQISGLAVLDMYAAIDPAAPHLRAAACDRAAEARLALDAGAVDSDNSFFVTAGELAIAAPDEISPLFGPPFSNRDTLLILAGQTYFFFLANDFYHLAATAIEGEMPIAFTESPELSIATWFATGASHQSLREVYESDALWCGEGDLPLDIDLASIEVPLLYLGAAGGIGAAGLHSTTLVGSRDVTTQIVTKRPPDAIATDVGHGDLLFGTDAPRLVWDPLSEWILSH